MSQPTSNSQSWPNLYRTPVSKVTFWPSAQWPDIGDNLGVALEEVFTGTQKDVPGALNDAAQYAQDAMEHARK